MTTTGCHASKVAETAAYETPASDMKQVTRNLTPAGSFTKVDFGGSHRIEISEGPFKVEVTGPKVLVDRTKLVVKQSTLTIERPGAGLVIKISMPSLSSITGSGAARFVYNGTLQADKFSLSLCGASSLFLGKAVFTDMDMNLSGAASVTATEFVCNQMKVNQSGGANVNIDKVSCTTCRTNISGGGVTRFYTVTGKDFSIECSGGSNGYASGIKVDKLVANASGGASITLKGKTKEARLSTTGAARIMASDLKTNSISKSSSGVSEIIY